MLLLYTGKAKSNGVWFSVSEMAAISPAVKEVLKILGLEVMQKALGNEAAKESTKVDVLISTDVQMLKLFLEVGGKSYEVLMDSDGRMKSKSARTRVPELAFTKRDITSTKRDISSTELNAFIALLLILIFFSQELVMNQATFIPLWKPWKRR